MNRENSERNGTEQHETHESRIAEYLTDLKRERYECTDEMPTGIANAKDPNYYKYKCRTNWWSSVTGLLDEMCRDGFVRDAEMKAEIGKFLAFVKTIDFKKFRTKEEIAVANEMLDKVIPHLEGLK